MDWRDDICTCASEKCPKKDQCVRSIQYRKPGIRTVSDLYELCKVNDEYFIKEDE